MEPKLKVSMPVVNVPGATGQTGLTKMLTAPADGYSMSVFIGDTFALQAGTPAPKWTMSEIVPLGVVIQQPSAFLVAEGGKFKSWADVEKIAKTETVRVAMLGFGSADDLTINYYVKKKGLKFVAVPFSKPGERYAAILGGHADILYEQIGDVRNFVDNKQMKPVLVFAEKRDENFKDVPTSVEIGDKVTLPQFRSIVVTRRHRPEGRQDAVRRARRRRQGPRLRQVPAGPVRRVRQLRCRRQGARLPRRRAEGHEGSWPPGRHDQG